ncbi:hypothetical protein B296_00047581 [Ensete ventricosum]|uniref:Uncharacterized protein n=1 Tax=Ensete ventricosum TaxID=4639 RepID=A0A426WWB4_ENSVE|nr:hypothetical protein B296_00047581 [Ensete ventricosum]
MGDLVLRKIEISDSTRSRGKLAPNWEDPYRVIDVVRDGTCTSQTCGSFREQKCINISVKQPDLY